MCQKDNEIAELKKTIEKLELSINSISKNNKYDAKEALRNKRIAQFGMLAYQFIFKDPTSDKKYEELKNLAKDLHDWL